jgi:Leucine-rich repeat (LRR) protein
LEALRGRVERRCYGGCFGGWNDTIAEKVDDWIESVLGASFVTGCESASFTDGEMDPFPLEQVERGKNISQAKRDIHKCVDLSLDALTSVHIYLPGEIAKEIQLLSRCPNLSHLSINAGEIDSRVLADIGTMKKLERLEITLKHEVDLSPLAKLPILEHLEICGKLTDDGLETISQIKSLTWLNIGQTDVTSEGLNHLAELTQLELLDLAKTKVTSEGLKYLPVSLQCLTLDQCGLESNSHFGRLVQLRRLDMREAEISDQALANLPLKIEYLDLSNSRVTPKNLRHISRLSELHSLDLSNTFISDAVDEVLEDLPTSLEVLRLAGNRVTNDGVRRLTRLRKLRLLDLSNTLVTNDGLSYLGELPWLSNVNLDRTCISNPAALFQHPTLRNLRLRSTLIDDDSFRDILISTTIEDLDVSGTQLGDAGYAILKKCRNLRRISRLNTHVTKPHTDPFDPFK